jgi:hypothetical protein
VFAEEVEPTGAVPIELSLERYRFAALPNKFREQSEDKRLQPRMSCKLFPGSQLLNMVSDIVFFFLQRKIHLPMPTINLFSHHVLSLRKLKLHASWVMPNAQTTSNH